jgi:hypothetical protein
MHNFEAMRLTPHLAIASHLTREFGSKSPASGHNHL